MKRTSWDGKNKSNDICTINIKQSLWQPLIISSYWMKTTERKKKKENKNTCEYERVILKVIKK